jgi:hypothetical protein
MLWNKPLTREREREREIGKGVLHNETTKHTKLLVVFLTAHSAYLCLIHNIHKKVIMFQI